MNLLGFYQPQSMLGCTLYLWSSHFLLDFALAPPSVSPPILPYVLERER